MKTIARFLLLVILLVGVAALIIDGFHVFVVATGYLFGTPNPAAVVIILILIFVAIS